MLRLGTLLFFAVMALGQARKNPSYVSIDIGASGEVNATLTAPVGRVPPELPATFAHAVGCDMRGLVKSPYESRIEVHCPVDRTSPLTFRAAFRLSEIAPQLLQVGVDQLDLHLNAYHFRCLRFDPAVTSQDANSNQGSYFTQYSLDSLPPSFLVEGGFDVDQVRTLAIAAVALALTPFLLLLLGPSDPLRLRAYGEAIFVLGWIGWIWALLRADAGSLVSYVLEQSVIGPLLVLLTPPLVAVWVGSRLAAMAYVRVTSDALTADYYGRLRFWSGAAGTCFASTVLSLLLFTFRNGQWSLLCGFLLTIACVLIIWRIGRGSSQSLPDGDLRKRTFESAARAGVNLRGVSIVSSPAPRPPMALATRWGVIVLNEALLKKLSRREVDAVLCHELSHIGPVKRSALGGVYILLVASILGIQWFPNLTNLVPVTLLALYLMIKAWRRAGERKADLDSVRWSGDPEAMITGLARVAQSHGMPLEWGAPISWMMSHPPTMERIRAIALAGGISGSRIPELMEESRRPAMHSYIEATAPVVPEDAAFSPVLRKQLQTRLTVFVLAAPILLGLPSVWLLERMGLSWWAVVFAASLFSAVASYLASDWIVGSVRDTVKRRALARQGQGIYTGFSPTAEPRLFDGGYHYDLGMVRFPNGSLEFAGDRAQFILDRRTVQRVWLGAGPRHWMRRKVVYVECRPSPDVALAVFSFQSLEAWFWPWTTSMAMRLYRAVQDWHQGSDSSIPATPPLPCQIPQVEGSPVTFISPNTAVRSVLMYSAIAFFLSTLEGLFDPSSGAWDDLSNLFCPVAVSGFLAFFLVCPRLNWGRLKAVDASQSRLPADS